MVQKEKGRGIHPPASSVSGRQLMDSATSIVLRDGRCLFRDVSGKNNKTTLWDRILASGFPVGLNFDGYACLIATYLIYIFYVLLSPRHKTVNKNNLLISEQLVE
jgi:hypothetical protein